MNSKWFLSVFAGLLIFSGQALASDHIDGPITTEHAITDLADLYAFPTPGEVDSMSVVLNTHINAESNTHFNENIFYKLFIREANPKADEVGFDTFNEKVINCYFKTPYKHDDHEVICEVDGEKALQGKVGQVVEANGLKVFTGQRSDPFFFNIFWVRDVTTKGKIDPGSNNNIMARLNVLSIVMDIDMKTLFPDSQGSMFSIAASSSTVDPDTNEEKQLDWVGRPEITNVTMFPRNQVDLRDEYNKERPYSLSEEGRLKYFLHISGNLDYYDSLDQTQDFTDSDQVKLTNLLLDDYLVIDLGMPCQSDNYFSIEKAVMEGVPHDSCGGRHLNDDFVDVLFNLYINAGTSDEITDGVDKPFRDVSDEFPYLQKPESGFLAGLAWLKAKALLFFAN